MEDQLITVETAKLAKEKGFDGKTLSYYGDNIGVMILLHHSYNKESGRIIERDWNHFLNPNKGEDFSAPTQSLLQRWLREQHQIHIYVYLEFIGSDEWEYVYTIQYLPKDKQDVKRRSIEFITINSYKEGIGTYVGAWHTHEEALEQGLIEALKLIP